MNKIPVLVTGVGGGGVGRQVMKALSFVSSDYKVIAADMSPLSYGLYEADKHYLLPPAVKSNYIDSLIQVCKKEKVLIVIPGSEPELLTVTQNLKRLKEEGLIPLINSEQVINTCVDKGRLFLFLKQKGVKIPRSKLIFSERDIKDINYYPVVVKPSRGSGGSNMVFFAQEPTELLFFSSYLRKYGYEPLVQEYIGSYEEEYTIGVLSVEKEILGSFALKRDITSALSRRFMIKSGERKFVISSGISQGIVDKFDNIRSQAEKIAETIKSVGPLNIQGRVVGGQLYVFEINPRFSGTTSIRAMMGWNEPDILIKYHLFGHKPTQSYQCGYVLRDLSEKIIPFENMG